MRSGRHAILARFAYPLVLGLVAVLILSACGSSTKTGKAAAGDASWRTIELTDVAGRSFSIADLTGKPVVIENFATWCSNCRRQLGDTQRAAAKAGAKAVFVALSVETDLDASKVAAYAKAHDFDNIRFAVMTPEFLAAMSDAYGPGAINPPSTPKIVVDSAGKPGRVVTGFESPDGILAKVTAAT